jgi:tetratricopeptide (TPR) repeat protein
MYLKEAKNAADVDAKKQNLKLALSHLKSAVEIYPHYADALLRLGNVHYEIKLYSEAVEYYNLLISLRANRFDVHLNLGICYLNHIKDVKKSIEHFQKAVMLNSQSTMALNGLGQAFFEKRDYEKAKAAFERLLELEPQNSDCISNIELINGFIHENRDQLAD